MLRVLNGVMGLKTIIWSNASAGASQLTLRHSLQCSDSLCGRNQGDDDYGKDSVDRDERRLAELGRRTVEMFVLSHVYTESLEVHCIKVPLMAKICSAWTSFRYLHCVEGVVPRGRIPEAARSSNPRRRGAGEARRPAQSGPPCSREGAQNPKEGQELFTIVC